MPRSCEIAIDIIVKCLDEEGIMVNTPSVEFQVNDWYNHTDIADPLLLATCVLNWGSYRLVNYNDIVMMSKAFFG